MDDLIQVLADYKTLEKAFDNIRLVDPVKKRVLNYHEKKLENTEVACYAFWSKNKVCHDCVSIRAYHDNRTYVKLEYSKDQIYILTTIPIELQDDKLLEVADAKLYMAKRNGRNRVEL